MRTRISVLLVALLTVSGLTLALPASPAGAALADEDFAAFGTGTVISSNVLTLGESTVGAVRAAVAGNSLDSQGLTPLTDELGQNINGDLPGKNAHGRGTGLEVGLAVPADQQEDVNQLLLSGLAEASAPPPEGVPDPITKDISIDLPGLVSASALHGEAQAIYDPNTCAIGQPVSYGLGSAADLRLVGPADAPLVGTATPADPIDNTVSQSTSFSYFIPNPDGSFGLVSEVHQIVAPVTVLNNALTGPALTIEVAGEFIIRATATGIAGDPRNGISYPGNPLINIKTVGGIPLPGFPVELQDILGPVGITVGVPGVATVSLGQAPRAIGGAPGSAPEVAGDGTFAAAAVDAVGSVQLLEALGVLDLRIGHMEVGAAVPAGGVHCTIPVAKTATPNPAQAGQEITWTISIPSDPVFFATFFACDLIGITATDTHSVLEGSPSVELIEASNGGVVNGDTVTWDNLGNYTRGSPPIVLTVKGRVIGGTGVLQDTVDVSATLGNCDGGIVGEAIVGSGAFENIALTGAVTLLGPDVRAGQLAATGNDTRYLLLGGLFLLGAFGIRRRLLHRGEAKA